MLKASHPLQIQVTYRVVRDWASSQIVPELRQLPSSIPQSGSQETQASTARDIPRFGAAFPLFEKTANGPIKAATCHVDLPQNQAQCSDRWRGLRHTQSESQRACHIQDYMKKERVLI